MTASDVASVNEQPEVFAVLQLMSPQATDDDLEVSRDILIYFMLRMCNLPLYKYHISGGLMSSTIPPNRPTNYNVLHFFLDLPQLHLMCAYCVLPLVEPLFVYSPGVTQRDFTVLYCMYMGAYTWTTEVGGQGAQI